MALNQQQRAVLDTIGGRPRGGEFTQTQIQTRQVFDLMRILITCDAALEEAFNNHCRALPFLEIRRWCEEGIRELAAEITPPTPISLDPVLLAQAEAIQAAIKGDTAAYQAARAKESAARTPEYQRQREEFCQQQRESGERHA